MSRRKWVMGNWKMNGSLAQAKTFFSTFLSQPLVPHADISLGIPSVYLDSVYESFKDKLDNSSVYLGAQDVSAYEAGAYTGEISATMLKSVGVRAVIVGHSERRQYHQESDVLIGKKAKAVFDAGLIPVVCVGETLQERQSNQTTAVLHRQLSSILSVTGISLFERAILAYEPVWAIGTGLAATPAQIQEVHAFLRAELSAQGKGVADGTRIVYGGSLKLSNAQSILELPDVDGGLIGGASLKLEEFLSIIQLA
jgi:triosephosphate isomerase